MLHKMAHNELVIALRLQQQAEDDIMYRQPGHRMNEMNNKGRFLG